MFKGHFLGKKSIFESSLGILKHCKEMLLTYNFHIRNTDPRISEYSK